MSELAEQSFKYVDPSDELTRRIYGIEQEFGTEIPEKLDAPFQRAAQYIRKRHGVTAIGSSANLFLSNGSRFYNDYGGHWEYASAEAQDVSDAVAGNMAGEELLTGVVDNAFERRATSEGQSGGVRLNTRIIDDHGNTWGVHENYLMHRGFEVVGSNAEVLAAHLATRALFTGAGRFWVDDRHRTKYWMAQKISDIDVTVAHATTSGKPLINTRDESHAHSTAFRRQHITCGDPCMLPWAAAMKMAGTSLVLRMLEHRVDLSHVMLVNPVRAAKIFAGDIDGTIKAATSGGELLSAVDIQRRLAECALAFVDIFPVPEEEAIMAEEWIRAIEDFERAQHNPDVLATRVDWAAKWKIIRGKAWRQQEGQLDQRAARAIDIRWGDLSRNGLGLWVRHKKTVPDPLKVLAKVEERATVPPPGRAAQRGHLIHEANKYVPSGEEIAGWTLVKVPVDKQGKIAEVKLLDPYGENKNQARRVRSTIEMMRGSGRRRRK